MLHYHYVPFGKMSPPQITTSIIIIIIIIPPPQILVSIISYFPPPGASGSCSSPARLCPCPHLHHGPGKGVVMGRGGARGTLPSRPLSALSPRLPARPPPGRSRAEEEAAAAPPPPRHKVTPLCLHVPGGRAPPTAHGGVREGAADGRRKSSGSIGASRAAFSSPSSQDVRRPDTGDRFKSRTEEMNLSGDLLQRKKNKPKPKKSIGR